MKNKKLIPLLAMTLGLILSVSACGTSKTSKNNPSSNTPISSKQNDVDERIYAIYVLYAESTTNPKSYEEWLASIKGEQGEPGHTPVIAINNDGYWTIDGVSTGVKANGTQGTPGQKGADGTSLHTGQGTPNNSLGLTGDSYIDTNSWNYYVKEQNGWTLKGNFGRSGLNTIKTGVGAPDPLLGEVGDSYVNTDNWDFYVKAASGWQLVGNIKGQPSQIAWSNTILPSEHGYITASLGSAVVGTPITFIAHPDDGYYLSEFELNGQSFIGDVIDNVYTTAMVENGFVVRGTFSSGTAPVHKHNWSSTYSYDENGHWQACSGCSQRKNEGAHDFNEWVIDIPATDSSEGHEYRACKVCAYREEHTIPSTSHVHTANSWQSNDTAHYHVCSQCGEIYDIVPHTYVEINRVPATDSVDGYYIEKCSVCEHLRQTAIYANNQEITVYATNDIHGQIYEELTGDNYGGTYVSRVGVGKYMTFLKNKKALGKTLLLDQGDTWQGSIYSNYNHGGLLTDLMNYVQFDARTVGNHDFDWGVEPVVINAAKSYQGYTTPTLAANVYDYDFDNKIEGNTQQSQIGVPSVTYTIAGIKIGVIGTIGSSQITSITTNYVKNICFKDHIPIIKQEANKLRNEGCDMVILSHHGGQEDLTDQNLNQFIDLALCAHTHRRQSTSEGNLNYIQCGSNNKYVGEIKMHYNKSEQRFTGSDAQSLSASYIDSAVGADSNVDAKIDEMIHDNYVACLAKEPLSEVLVSNADGTFGQNDALPNLIADAIYEEAKAEGYDIYCSYVNNARHDITTTSWTYADIFEAFPFENEVYIMDVNSREMINEIGGYNFIRKDMNKWPNYFDLYDSATKYRIAVIDFLGGHTNDNREYDFFPSCQGQIQGKLNKTYRTILVEYLKRHNFDKGVKLDPDDYYDSNIQFQRYGCAPTKPCTLTFMLNDGTPDVYDMISNCTQGIAYSHYFPIDPTRNGYIFTGWYLDSGCTIPVDGVVTDNQNLYAGWRVMSSSDYSLSFTYTDLSNGQGGYYSGAVSINKTASSSSGSINVTFTFEDAIYSESYGEFGLTANKGFTITLPSGYAITSYEAQTYGTYDNLALYSDSSKTVSYPVGNRSVEGNRSTYSGTGVNYSSLYCYNTYAGGNFWFYYFNLVISKV